MHDMDVLEQALHTQVGYIGMIGSRKKRNALYKNSWTRALKRCFEHVHCPIGLGIEADTPKRLQFPLSVS